MPKLQKLVRISSMRQQGEQIETQIEKLLRKNYSYEDIINLLNVKFLDVQRIDDDLTYESQNHPR
jgi:hypothetical protein